MELWSEAAGGGMRSPRRTCAASSLAARVTGVGGWAFMVALAVRAYAVGGATAVGLAALVRMVPAGLAAPLTGLAADRFPRRDVLLAALLARAVLVSAAALAVLAGARRWRCCWRSRRCSPSPRPPTSPPRPRCCRTWLPTRRTRPPPTRSGRRSTTPRSSRGAVAGGRARRRLRRAGGVRRRGAVAFAAATWALTGLRRDPRASRARALRRETPALAARRAARRGTRPAAAAARRRAVRDHVRRGRGRRARRRHRAASSSTSAARASAG